LKKVLDLGLLPHGLLAHDDFFSLKDENMKRPNPERIGKVNDPNTWVNRFIKAEQDRLRKKRKAKRKRKR